ncbi:hypothetical protein JCM16303_005999 [Sporobolomyces ruberrimus]
MSCLATPLRFLPVLPQELQLATVLKSGQSFRWHRTTPVHATRTPGYTLREGQEDEEWSFGWGDRTVVLRQDDEGIHYRSLYPHRPPHTAYLADTEKDTTRPLLVDYFQLSTPLAPLYSQWSSSDRKFATKIKLDEEQGGGRLRGVRVLKQDEWETLVSFICSANNNIARITLMVNRLCAQLGSPLPHPTHYPPTPSCPSSPPLSPPNDLSLYSFPPPSFLTNIPKTESLLRQLGFGYRANFIPTSSLHLVTTSSLLNLSPLEYLESLRKDRYVEREQGKGLAEVREKLLEFKGVGRKVADCVMLFGLGWSEVVPVDTHVFQIAIRDYAFPSTKTTSLTPLLHDRVSEHLSKKWSPHAGWCQQVLFFADLKSTTNSSASSSPVKKGTVYSKIEIKEDAEDGEVDGRERKKSFEEEVKEIMENPGRKRRRVTVIKKEEVSKVKVKVEGEKSIVEETREGTVGSRTPIVEVKKETLIKVES